MKKTLLLIIIFYLNFNNADSQNCSSLVEWNAIINEEFPKVDTYHIRSGARVSNRILYNLYSDKYFVPFAGKSFDKLSVNAGKSISKKLRKCRSKKKYQSLKNIGWLSMIGVEPLTNPLVIERVKKQSSEVNTLRAEYIQLLSLFKSGGVTFNELARYKGMAINHFIWLMPSEVENYLKVIAESENKIANKTLLDLANAYNTKEANLATLNQLQYFESSNRQIYAAASENVKTEVAQILKRNKAAFVVAVTKKEQQKLEQLSKTNTPITNINSHYKSFNRSFSQYREYAVVKEHYIDIQKVKTMHVVNMSSKLGSAILSENNLESLKNLNSIYLTNVTVSSPVIGVLKRQLTTRENSIKKAQKIAQEKALAIKKAAEGVFATEEANRQRTIANHKFRVKKLREELRVEYGANLPKFEALHIMLFYYLRLVHDNKKYERKDAEFFIRHVEKTGYMRKNTGNISDVERFDSRSRFKIVATSLIGRPLTSVRLEIPNASKKMIELYSKELVSEFRHMDKATMTPSIMPTASDYYILSGRTKYSLKVDEIGTLILKATENRELTLPILADKMQVDTWGVNSFKSVTDVYVKKGQEVTILATGKVKVGDFMGSVTPAGISGYSIYNIVKNYNHGALMARIGGGNWTYIGNKATFTAKKNGVLYFKINDKFPDNNEGSFNVKYVVK